MIIELLGFVFTIIVGTVGHFLYEKSNYNKVIGFLFSKNESTWEHMKLGITPIILWTIVELFTYNFNNLFFAKFVSIIAFSLSLYILYYGYKKIVKRNILFLDILVFYISLFLATVVSINILMNMGYGVLLNFLGFVGIIFILYLYKKFSKDNFDLYIFKE